MNIKNQRGFATLEIILVVGIIAIFSTFAVPKMARILDKVSLDYELKHLYSELNLARSIGKSSTFHGGIFNNFDNTGSGQIEFWIYSNDYGTLSNINQKNRYQIMRSSLTASPYFRHNLTKGIEISLDMSGEYNTPLKIDCYKLGVSKTLTLNSKFGDKAEIKIDTVGRFRGYNAK